AWLWRQSETVVVSYTAALDRYCQDYLKNFKTECDRKDLGATFKRIAEAAAAGEDPRNGQILALIEAGRSGDAAPLMRALAAEEAARGKAQVKRAAQRYRDSGAIAFLTDTKTALEDYTRATELDPDNPEGWLRLGALRQRAGVLDQARDALLTALKTSGPADALFRYSALSYLGDIASSRGEKAEALKRFEESFSVLAKDEAGDSVLSSQNRVILLNRIASLHVATGQLDLALAGFNQAVELSKAQLAETPSDSNVQRALSVSYAGLGGIHQTRGEYYAALEFFRQALAIGEPLSEEDMNDQERMRDRSVLTSSAANIAIERGNLPLAADLYTAALTVSERLHAQDPNNIVWRRDLVVNHSRLGDIQLMSKALDAAARHYESAAAQAEAIYAIDRTNIESGNDLSAIYRKEGDVHLERGQAMNAFRAYAKAQHISKKLAAADPLNVDLRRSLAFGHNRLGDVLIELKDRQGALKNFTEGLAIVAELRASNPLHSEWRRDHFVTLGRLGEFHFTDGAFDLALPYFESAALLIPDIVAEPRNAGQSLSGAARVFMHIGDIHFTRRATDKAQQAYQQATEHFRRLQREAASPASKFYLFQTLIKLGSVSENGTACELLREARDLIGGDGGDDPVAIMMNKWLPMVEEGLAKGC
ncbi:MAG: hypothetical protein NW215_13240, partial [Hyphomicrobiales bacterium]|nr:hypothetical protein [Hyphomicrobiales bacterium]